MSGEPFHRCTHTALSPKGEIYVSDGYGNARVHKYSPDGKLLMSWGEPGTDPGQFNIVHNIVTDRGRLGVRGRPREPSRAGVRRQRQVRDAVEQPASAVRDLLLVPRRQAAAVHHRRARPGPAGQSEGARISGRAVASSTSRASASRGSAARKAPGTEAGKFIAPHGIALDSRGDIYVGEVAYTNWPQTLSRHADAGPHPLAAEAGEGGVGRKAGLE